MLFYSWFRITSGLGHNKPRNQGLNEQNILVDTLAAMQRRMTEQDVRIAEQMEEIWNLRQQLQLQGDSRNKGNGGNPLKTKAEDNQSRSENDRSN